MSTPFLNTSLASRFNTAVGEGVNTALSQMISLYATQWVRAWGLPLQNSKGQAFVSPINPQGQSGFAVQPPQEFASLSVSQRLTILGANLLTDFEALGDLKTFIESHANSYLAANGVPAVGDSMYFLTPFIVTNTVTNTDGTTTTTNVFTLPGTPVGHTVTFNTSNGSWTYTPPPQTTPTTNAPVNFTPTV